MDGVHKLNPSATKTPRCAAGDDDDDDYDDKRKSRPGAYSAYRIWTHVLYTHEISKPRPYMLASTHSLTHTHTHITGGAGGEQM